MNKKIFKTLSIFVMLLGFFLLTSCDKEPTKLDSNAVYSEITETLTLEKNLEGKTFLKNGIEKANLNRIADGDTVSFTTESGDFVTIRFYGIDTPESTGDVQKWGVSASKFAKSILNDASEFILESNTGGKAEHDSYGVRYLGYVWYRNGETDVWKNLNLQIVENGYSKNNLLNSPNEPYYTVFNKAETFAKQGKLHIWGTDEDPNYTTEAIEVSLKDLSEHPDEYWNIETGVGSRVKFVATIIDLVISSTDTHTFTAAQLIDGKIYTFKIYTGYASSPTSSYLKIGNSYNLAGVVQLYGNSYQISGLEYVLGESGGNYTSLAKKNACLLFDNSIEYATRYASNLKYNAKVTAATLAGTTLSMTISCNGVDKNGVSEELETYTVTTTVDATFDVNTVLNKAVKGKVYLNGDFYYALNLNELSLS